MMVRLQIGRRGLTTALTERAQPAEAVGHDAYELMERLYPLCRSLTGDGVRASFDLLEEESPSPDRDPERYRGVRLGRAGGVEHSRRVHRHARRHPRVDFRRSTLHVVSYSEPVRATLSLDQLREHLYTLPDSRT